MKNYTIIMLAMIATLFAATAIHKAMLNHQHYTIHGGPDQ